MTNNVVKSIFILCSAFIFINVNAQTFQKEIPVDYGYIVKLGQTVPDFDLVLPDGTKPPCKPFAEKW